MSNLTEAQILEIEYNKAYNNGYQDGKVDGGYEEREKIFTRLEQVFPWIYQGVNAKPWQALKGAL